MPKRIKKIKWSYEELGDNAPNWKNSTSFGECLKSTGEIWVDPRQKPSELLDTEVHEILHIVCPFMSETNVRNNSKILSKELWKLGYRKILKR